MAARHRMIIDPSKVMACCMAGIGRPGTLGLHPMGCQGSAQDIRVMQLILHFDPESLNRVQWSCDVHTREVGITCYDSPTFPVHDAARIGHVECVKFLVEAGANLLRKCSECERHSCSIVEYANHSESFEILKILIDNGANPNLMYKNYIIPNMIYLPAENGDNEFLKFMLENESVPEDLEVTQDTFKIRPLLIPIDEKAEIEEGNGEVVLNPRHIRTSPLTTTLYEGHVETYRLLLFYGATNVLYFHASDIDHETSMTFYSIPHFIPNSLMSPYFNQTTTETVVYGLRVYRMFGGNMWSTMPRDANFWVTEDDPPPEVRCSETALTYLRRKPAILARFPGLEGALAEMMQRPLSLKELSRLAVRRAMGRHMWRYIGQLDLPEELKTFLHFPVEE